MRLSPVVRRVFEMSARGHGFRDIAKTLTRMRCPSPRAQQGRPRGGRRHRFEKCCTGRAYRGIRVWNKTKKRDGWGQKRRSNRSPDEWLEVPARVSRIVSDALWWDVHERMKIVRAGYERWRDGDTTAAPDWSRCSSVFLSGLSPVCSLRARSMQVSLDVPGSERRFQLRRATRPGIAANRSVPTARCWTCQQPTRPFEGY